MSAPATTGQATATGDRPARIVPRVNDTSRTAVARSRVTDTRTTGSVAVPRPQTNVVVHNPRTVVYYSPVRRGYQHSFYYYPYPNYYYYYPRHHYPYGYGTFGIGYFYYDPYVWAPVSAFYYNGSYFGYGRGYEFGELRLQVRPRNAEVYVDGYYAGLVDDFDGVFQSLRLEAGEYRIEIVAPGYVPIEIDVRIDPGRKTSYRHDMLLE